MIPANALLVSDDRETVLCALRGGFAVMRLTAGAWEEMFFSLRLAQADIAFELSARQAA